MGKSRSENLWTLLRLLCGPGKLHKNWGKAVNKFLERSQSWDASRDGLFFAVLAYNTFVISTLSFIGQLERVTPQVLEAEASALRHMVPGPGN